MYFAIVTREVRGVVGCIAFGRMRGGGYANAEKCRVAVLARYASARNGHVVVCDFADEDAANRYADELTLLLRGK